MVLDPFCGCATTCVASEILERQWVGIDISEEAFELLQRRLSSITNEINTKDQKRKQLFHTRELPDNKTYKRYNHPDNKKELLSIQGNVCKYCKREILVDLLEIDYRIPKSLGGADSIKNLQLLCSKCNRKKGNMTDAEFLKKMKLTEENFYKMFRVTEI